MELLVPLERPLYAPLIDGADGEDWLLYRIADGSSGYKPFDMGGLAPGGRAVCVEVKVSEEKGEVADLPLPWKLFSMRQRGWLNEFASKRAIALAILYYSETKTMSVYRIPVSKEDMQPRKELHVGDLLKVADTFVGWRKLRVPTLDPALPTTTRKRGRPRNDEWS